MCAKAWRVVARVCGRGSSLEDFAGRYLRQVLATAQGGPTMLHIPMVDAF